MTARARLTFTPRLMRAPDAAKYLGMSETRFRDHVNEGRIPQPKVDGKARTWDIADLDSFADSLPRKGEPANDDWDGVAL